MNKKNILKIIEENCEPIIEDLGYDLVDIEFIKENGQQFLRFYIGNVEGITIGDCQKVSEAVGNKLDEIDIIKNSYYLEISSPGLDRPLKTDKDLRRNIGKEIEVSLYKNIDGKKKYTGKLASFTQENIIIIEENQKERAIQRDIISNIKLVVKF
ncbi:ribosome maturation factor RimP [Keratinibaculum paraultunense]|uniref:Ribosome maturation factor RimP n=1 Tax=Keratinibaculum paraultunense TaxID=1278232 RepID=A0A4R3KW01_9FIRM|nr:ribosome maturation factor RimP [Keratinibaculum paraultunense]QQY80699.1 ribosome maturation factor RimP [Keratinibaculum paraultunense]TCS89697.1 ribosome maturation factor RimP [Keratinibaculum paraultunense]